jgi:hypothetical protein
MNKNSEYLHHVHGASANEASILIDAHEAIESNQKLSKSDESLLAILLTSFRNSHLIFEYMDIFYGDSPWPALETAITEWLITGYNYTKKDAFYNLIKPYHDRVNNIDWLIDNLKSSATSDKGAVKPLFIILHMVKLSPISSRNTVIEKSLSSLFIPYIEEAAIAVTQIFGPESIITVTHLWDTIDAGRDQKLTGASMIFDWAVTKKLYYFQGNRLYNAGFKRNFIDACNLYLKSKEQYEKMFSMFDFDDFLEDTSLIIPYCERVLEGRFYDIEEYLKTMNYTLYKQYLQSVPQFANYWKSHM